MTSSRALAVPLLLLGIEDGFKAARVKIDEDFVWVDGLFPAVLPFQGCGDPGVRSPLGNNRPVQIEKQNEEKIEQQSSGAGS